jgi:molybdenum cofactor biosynthesis protein B
MVDFQSRSTRRGDDEEDEDEEPEVNEEETADEEAESEPEPEVETEPDVPEESPNAELAFAVVTVSGDRSISEDTQGDAAVDAIAADGNVITTRDLIQPSYDGVQNTISTLATREDVDVVVTIGGTGVEPNDVTVGGLEPLFDKHMPGFGELYRRLAAEEQGSGVVGTRATAGIVAQVPVFVLPGTVGGATLALEQVVLPEAGRLAAEATPDDPASER